MMGRRWPIPSDESQKERLAILEFKGSRALFFCGSLLMARAASIVCVIVTLSLSFVPYAGVEEPPGVFVSICSSSRCVTASFS